MNEPVDLTKCQPGDLLKLRCGQEAFYFCKYCGGHHIGGGDWSIHVGSDGRVSELQEARADAVAIVHPTRAELEEQRWELLEALKSAIEDWRLGYDHNDAGSYNEAIAAIARAEGRA